MTEHPNVTFVKSLFQKDKNKNISLADYDKGGFASNYHPNLTYVGTSARGELQVCLGNNALLAMAQEPAALMDSDGPGEELLACIAFGDELVSVHARSHRKIKKTGERVSYEWVMTVRVENGIVTRGVDVGEAKIDKMYKTLQGLPQDVPVTSIVVSSGTASGKV
ncbi:MAG TPA: nuclear transport factor 2 family protein [Roseimicrobium sp.]|nr:nuclear transport factor 2 family protein [Roseimicrobium sp.]